MELKGVVLLSGGIDSATTMLWAKRCGYEVYALSFRYGQRHEVELERAKALALEYSVREHVVIDIDIRKISRSAVTGDFDVPKNRMTSEMSAEIPITYVPARNTIFMSFALGFAETLQAYNIFIGANAVDYSGYPDCRPEYLKAFESMANLATRAGVSGKKITVHAPLINLSKAEIIKLGYELGLDFSLTHSCYDPSSSGEACGACDSCIIRRKGFLEAGLVDPASCIKQVD